MCCLVEICLIIIFENSSNRDEMACRTVIPAWLDGIVVVVRHTWICGCNVQPHTLISESLFFIKASMG